MHVRVLTFYSHIRPGYCSRILADYIVGQGCESSQTTYKGGPIRRQRLFLTLSSLSLLSVHFSTSCSAELLFGLRWRVRELSRWWPRRCLLWRLRVPSIATIQMGQMLMQGLRRAIRQLQCRHAATQGTRARSVVSA
jgi:hypothetical protein